MGPAALPGRRRWARAAAAWPIWDLPTWLLIVVLAVIAADAAAILASALSTSLRGHDAELFGLLLSCDIATVELTRRSGEPAGLIKSTHPVWELPIALLLPPVYGLIAPIARIAFTQWRIRRSLAYRRVYTVAALGLSYAAASVSFRALTPVLSRLFPEGGERAVAWAVAVVVCGVLRSAVNKLLVMTAVKGSEPTASIRSALFTREAMFEDAAELSVGVLVAYAVTASPFMALFALPIVTLLQRSQRHLQLVNDARIDGKTGLLNGMTWQREAAVQVTRTTRSRGSAPLAVLLADADHFKDINDRHGHQTGDAVLTAMAQRFGEVLRPGDLCGRFGIGDEFAVLLLDTTAPQATAVARRLCDAIAEITVEAKGDPDGAVAHVTVSIGVAAIDRADCDLDDLIAAADHALYKAKKDGRNTVRMALGPGQAGDGGS
jgi:diguanylate cyclase (GGDEF)-like protein